MIAYQPEAAAEIREIRDEWWGFSLPVPAKPIRTTAACETDVNEWFTKDQINEYLRDLATYLSRSQVSAVAKAPTLAERFHEQAKKWDRETGHMSSPSQRFSHPSYQAILGMANDNRYEIVHLMIRDMQQHRREWFWALSYLTHENPIEQKDIGKLDKMIKAWVDWEKRRGALKA